MPPDEIARSVYCQKAIFRMQLPLCFFNRHTPIRNRVRWDGLHFISTCERCGKPIRRRDKKRWEKEWLDDHGKSLGWVAPAKPEAPAQPDTAPNSAPNSAPNLEAGETDD